MGGGRRWPRPGEISLAHRGVLFLDELPAAGSQRVLEVTRSGQPLAGPGQGRHLYDPAAIVDKLFPELVDL